MGCILARPKSYRELIVWQKAMALARQAYLLSKGLPRSEAFGLLSQIRRAAVSIPSNIAEGHGRLTDSQFRHFLGNARGSLYEMQTQVELAGGLGFIEQRLVENMLVQGGEVGRLINGLVSALGRSIKSQAPNGKEEPSTDSANSAKLR